MRYTLALLLLAGCSTMGDFSSGMNTLVGQPAETAFARLGYPERQEQIAGRTIYYYGTDHAQGASCAFKLVTEGGIVRSWDGIGNAAGCDLYLKGLRG
jgi:hypothetical protein